MPSKDLSQHQFGHLRVVEKVGTKTFPAGNKRVIWKCLCVCGKEKIATTTDLQSGNVTSCGCKRGKTEFSFCGSLDLRFWSKVDKSGECWEWRAYVRKDGYGYFGLSKGKPSKAHRISWELTNGPIPDGLFVLHKCDNRKCVNPKHLFLGTHQENMDDMWAKGRQQSYSNLPRGERNHSTMFDAATVMEIRRRREEEGLTIRKLSSLYGVAYNAIWQIVNRKSWTHV